MGEDRDVCVVTFKVKDRHPAKDLMEFIEKGFDFVLDSDVSSGENDQGEYYVFVEMERNRKILENLEDLMYGVKKLTGTRDWKFRYHKQDQKRDFTIESIKENVPLDPERYDGYIKKTKTLETKNFFSKTLMDDLTMEGDVITIHKPYDRKLHFKMIKEGIKTKVLKSLKETFTADNESTAEILWLTKVMGDYNINKIGNYFIFENGDRAMLLQRIQ